MTPDPQHQQIKVENVSCGVFTISDTRTQATDKSGQYICEALQHAGHTVCHYEIIPDEPEEVRRKVLLKCENQLCHAILLTGGTGLSSRDTTFEAVFSLFEKRLDGFGELFRMLSYDQVGSSAMLSRAVAGVCHSTVIFSMPGSTGAVELAMNKLILPELKHLVALLQS